MNQNGFYYFSGIQDEYIFENLESSEVTNMSYMFWNLVSLVHVSYGNNFIQNVDSNISHMFYNCPANKSTHESWNGVFEG